MRDLILYDVRWRMRFISAIRGCVYTFFISLVLFGFFITQEQNRVYTTESYNELIFIYGEAKKNDIRALQKELSKAPEWLIEDFISNNGRIYLTSIPIGKLQENYIVENDDDYANTIGLFVKRKGTLKTWIYNSPLTIEKAALHELGHYLDWHFGHSSKSSSFLMIFEQEKLAFLEIDDNTYHISTAAEYFAACFKWYLNNPRLLKRKCPQTHSFFGDIVTS